MTHHFVVAEIITAMITWFFCGMGYIFDGPGSKNGYLALAALFITLFPIVFGVICLWQGVFK